VSEERLEFIGYVSHPSLGEEPVRGRLVLVQWRVRFEAEAVTFEIPVTRLRIERDEADPTQLWFSDPQNPAWRIYTFGEEILDANPLLQQPNTRNQIRELQSGRELKRRLKLTFGFVAGFAGLCLAGSMLLGMMVRALVHRVPSKWEQKLGDDAMKEIRRRMVFVQDTNLQARLDWAVAPLMKALPASAQCKFYLLDESTPNAFALPGGYVVVHTGLMTLADRPEEIAGVIAHELAHVTEKHGLRILISSAGPFFIVKTFFGGGEGLFGMLGAGSQLLVRQSFSQEYEQEADDAGWQLLVSARIDPRGLPDMLRKLEDAYGNMNVIRPELGAFSSHPATEKRIERLDAKWKRLKDKSGFMQYQEADGRW
jgi:Zn-dependent protease with chaperone function